MMKVFNLEPGDLFQLTNSQRDVVFQFVKRVLGKDGQPNQYQVKRIATTGYGPWTLTVSECDEDCNPYAECKRVVISFTDL